MDVSQNQLYIGRECLRRVVFVLEGYYLPQNINQGVRVYGKGMLPI